MKAGWEVKKIEDVCQVIPGQSPNSKHYNKEANGLPFYQGKKEFTNRVLGQPTQWTTFVTKEAVAGDIVMSVRAPVGPVNEVSEPICIGRGLAAIRSGHEIKKDFLWYFLLSIQSEIEGKDGAVFPSINRREIESIELTLPPLEEQQRIVDILHDAFAKLETARSNTAANLESSKELFQSVLNESLSGAEEKGWKIKPLKDCVETFNIKKKIPKKVYQSEGKFPIISQEEEKVSGYWDVEDDVTQVDAPVIIYGDHTQVVKLVDFDFVAGADGIKPLKPKDGIIAAYLCYFIQANRVPSLGYARHFRHMKEVLVTVPPLEEQQRIVEKLDSLREQTDSLQQEYAAHLADIDELRQSLLQKAFAGELT